MVDWVIQWVSEVPCFVRVYFFDTSCSCSRDSLVLSLILATMCRVLGHALVTLMQFIYYLFFLGFWDNDSVVHNSHF